MTSVPTIVCGVRLFLLLFSLSCFGQMQLWKYVPADPPSLTVMEWRRVLDSPDRELFRREIPPATLQLLGGVNFIEGIERAVVSGTGDGALILLGGNFDPAALREAAVADGGIVKMYREAQILQPADPEQVETQIALVGRNVVLLGKREVVLAALDVFAGKIQPRGAGYDLWITNKNPSANVVSSEFGMVHLKDGGIRVDCFVRYRNAALAENSAQSARAYELIAVQTGTDLKVTGNFAPDVFSRRLGMWRTSLEQLIAAAAPEQESAPIPKGPLKVKIYGLEGGTKELTIPTQTPPK